MDRRSIDQIRNANFAHAVRGYDRGEVDTFLAELAEWLATGGADNAGSEAVRAEFERVGEQTTGILTEAYDAAQQIKEDATRDVRQQLVDANVTAEGLRGSAEDYSEQTREQADVYARKARKDADGFAEQARADAEAEAAETRAAAEREAEEIVAEGIRRSAEIEARIGDLEARRDAVLAELDRLASGIAGAATRHRDPDESSSTDPPDGAEGDAPRDQTGAQAPTQSAPSAQATE